LAIKLPAVEPVVDDFSSAPELMPSTTGSTAGRLYTFILESNAYTHINTNRIMTVLVPKENTLTGL